jgi:hypothetical protein
MTKLKLLLTLAGGLVAFVCLGIYISQEKQSARQAQLDKNLREASFGGAPDLFQSPKLEIGDRVFEIGVVAPLDRVSRVFTVHNQGQKPLKVRLRDQTCSCVTVHCKFEKIHPGQSGVIDVAFTAPADEKPVDHDLQFSTNDPLKKEFTLQVRGEVRRTVWTEPRELDFIGLMPNDSRQREFRVFSTWEEGCEIGELKGVPAGFQVSQQPLAANELAAVGAKSGQLFTISIPSTWTGKAFVPLVFDAVRAGGQESMRKSVQLNASRLSRLSLSHDLLDMLGKFEIGNIPYGTGRQYTLFVEARGEHRELSLARVDTSPSFLRVSLEPGVNAATSGLHLLKIEIPPDAPEGSYAGDDQATVTLHFDDPEYPAVTFHPDFHITRD